MGGGEEEIEESNIKEYEEIRRGGGLKFQNHKNRRLTY
jgi:hypothetical protein